MSSPALPRTYISPCILETEMWNAGYVRSPNNIYGLPSIHHRGDNYDNLSPEWYPGSGGIPCPNLHQYVQVCADRIRVFEVRMFGTPYTKRTYSDTITVAMFETVAEFIEWCKENGRSSLPGRC